ncbi:hypothetical protein K493DRAFT_296803 [Basidiobolus meristosporus CBS 931.73]|uniref:Yeast cell wall synthesis Kre9/Knh1-like N-terminal domain-containing protein n=1 Tax=Basidiobolus meristosporus CBS 931.73 TaxID=1314790 RepID=A0A1Y1Z3H0_9FUNG|nr:hypothetical protein K493DRAFT_296803 [Basidiobolus meristosporus CBS 931.73]|eukprot:ORY04831.1 hypothetical protein K493DRAFT_296803 [Basidiobolus meristosporus CBS 931.73]
MIRILCLLASLFVTAVLGDFSITSPVSAVWKAGTQEEIKWKEDAGGDATPGLVDLQLLTGASNNLTVVLTIDVNINSTPGSYKWNIPGQIPEGNQYVLRIGSGKNQKYSPYFIILNPVVAAGTPYTGPKGPAGSSENSGNSPVLNAKSGVNNGSTDANSKPSAASLSLPSLSIIAPALILSIGIWVEY